LPPQDVFMGRTIPSFRLASVDEYREWKEFRSRLDKSDMKVFDRMFDTASLYNSACSYAASPIRIQPIFMSIIFHHHQTLRELRQKAIESNNRVGA
jgi:hypothetical protein